MTVTRSTLNANATIPDPSIDTSTSYSVERFKHSTTGPPSVHAQDEDQDDPEGWDTANEGTAEGDGRGDEEEEPPVSPEERERRRRLKGKAVEVASDGDEDLPNHNHSLSANRHRPNGRSHPRHFSTPPLSSAQGSSASPAPIVNGMHDPLPLPRPPGASRRSHSTPYHDDSEGQMLSAPPIPSVNVIPTSPPPHGRAGDSRPATGSLDIPHSLTDSSSQESLRRRETLGASSAAERRNNRRSFDPRRGSNRLSGFFSNLLHLRDRNEPTSNEQPPTAASPSPPTSTAAPRPSSSRSNVTQPGSLQPLQPLAPPSSESLQPVERPPTPPPALPAPSLRELGLQMTAITPALTPPHFPSPPVSGVFLAPHYLLLCHYQGLDVMPLDGSLPPQPYALIRRVAFKSVLVMEERGVLVAIAGRREGVRVYSLDEVRKAVEWRIHAEIEKERERHDGLGGEWEHVQKAFFGSTWPVEPEDGNEDPLMNGGLPSKLSIDNPNAGPRLRGVSAPFVPIQPTPPAQEVVPSPRRRRSSLPPSPPPPYVSLGQPASSSEPSPGQTSGSSATPTGSSQPTPYSSSSPNSLAVPEEAAGPSRQRNASISTISPPTPAHTVVPPTANDEEEPANEKGKGVDRTGGPLNDDEKGELERTVESDDEALDPVAAGPSASAALDERTSAMAAAAAAAEAQTMVVSPVENNNRAPSIRRPSVSASLSSRRQARPSNLDLSPSALGAPSPNLPVVASPVPTLRSMRQALSHSDTIRRPPLAPRSPRASTSLSLSGVEDGMPDSPTEIGEDFISFAQALAESRLPSAPPMASGSNPHRSSSVPLVVKPAVPASSIISALAASRNGTSSAQPDPSMGGRYGNLGVATPPPVPPVPKEIPLAAKKRRRFSMVLFGKASSPSSSGSNRTARASIMPMSAASASTPNLMESGPSSVQVNGSFSPPAMPTSSSGPAEPLPPPSAPASVGRSQSNSSLAPGDGPSSSAPGRSSLMPGSTADRMFGQQTAPSSPMKTSRSTTSFHSTGSGSVHSAPPPPSPRTSRRFLPKLFTGLKKHHDARNSKDLNGRQRSEAEKRLAAGGAASAAAISAPMLGNPGPTVPAGRVNDAAAVHMTIVQAPPPKLEYVKLPGTKGALTIKAVETSKKSFLAILCGDAGEKIELFAGTYKTALGLSRTFILPDSPRSLELQLQGDDLVELFLVFAQNVFALEPATVRVREVRINRAERRAARRRAREARNLLAADNPEIAQAAEEPPPSETIVTSVVTVGTDLGLRNRLPTAPIPGASTSPSMVTEFNNAPSSTPPPGDGIASEPATAGATPIGTHLPAGTTPEELAALVAVAQFGPYTTFQQLSYAPAFPLGTIADDYIIPPTYPDFLDYRQHHESDAPSITELLAAPNTPPTLGPTPSIPVPPPPPTSPPMWFYVDPKGVVQGPWKSALMQSWFEDGFLPPDLPIRRDTETEYTPLRALCATAKHSNRPFRAPTPPPTPPISEPPLVPNVLLHPISILAQPRRFGPPALFYTSRGGHSTSIVDAKGKSVLRGRINWTPDDENTRLGDVTRLEAFDTRNRAILLALRQGGIEAADVGDALCFPGDESRPILPHFHPEAPSVSRRPPFTWRLGSQFNAAGQTVSSSDLPSTASVRENSKRSARTSGKKMNTGPIPNSRPASRSDGNATEDSDGLLEEEVLYLGRHRNVVYFCERNAGSFRIISLGTLESC